MNILKRFRVLEGLDGAGTTTQLNLLEKKYNTGKNTVITTCEPSHFPTGKLIRKILSGEISSAASTIARLFSADRDNHLFNPECGIIRMIKNGKTVISDRYLFSSLAYQSIDLDFDFVYGLNSDFPLPQVTFYLDTPLDICMERIIQRGNKTEIYEKKDYLQKVERNYKKCIEFYSEKCKIIILDGSKSITEIFEQITEVTDEMLLSD